MEVNVEDRLKMDPDRIEDSKTPDIKQNVLHIDVEVIKTENIKVECEYMSISNNALSEDSESKSIINDVKLQTEFHLDGPVMKLDAQFQCPQILDNKQATSESFQIVGKVYENGKVNRITCTVCGNTFKNRDNLKRHLKFIHTEQGSVECDKCFRIFKSPNHLKSHTDSVHAVNEEVTCKFCSKVFMNKKKLDNHIFYTHPSPEESVTCSICLKTFKRQYNLKVHMRTVHPTNSSVKCPHCDKTFKLDMLLQRHIKWSHPMDGMIYKCQICCKILPSIVGYRKHVQNVHNTSSPCCDYCQKIFKTKSILSRHIKIVHVEGKKQKAFQIRNIACTECDKRFSNKSALYWHFQRHHKMETAPDDNFCNMCQKEFTSKYCLEQHLETVHSLETATCVLCSKTFRSPTHLEMHVKTTHTSPEEAATCNICNKTYKNAFHLRIHSQVHNKGDFKCEVCDKVFSLKKYLDRHVKIHSETKEIPCPICREMFKTRNALSKHNVRYHKDNFTETNTPSIIDNNVENVTSSFNVPVNYAAVNAEAGAGDGCGENGDYKSVFIKEEPLNESYDEKCFVNVKIENFDDT